MEKPAEAGANSLMQLTSPAMHTSLCPPPPPRSMWGRVLPGRVTRELARRIPVARALVALSLLAAPGQAQAPPEPQQGAEDTIGLDEIEIGMRGHGLSVFAGTEPQRFEVEVVGKLENLNADLSFIMANLEGQGLRESGVIGGMSGSPVYLDGRLAGAVAFSWNFSQGALAGITPIAAMRDLANLPSPAASAPRSTPGWRPVAPDSELAKVVGGDFAALLARHRSEEELERWFGMTRAPSGVRPDGASAASQFLTVGFDDRSRRLLAAGLPAQLGGAGAVGAGRSNRANGDPADVLGPGAPVSAVLVGGDLQMAVNGTVTERIGDSITAFGHPYLGIGPVRLPMATAEVVTVVSSRLSSFKLSNVGEIVGAFDEDRLAGIRGHVGAVAPTTPMTVTVTHPDEGERRFDMVLADLQPMRPMLVAATVLQCIDTATRVSGDAGFDLHARFVLADHPDLVVAQSFDGVNAGIDAAIYLLQVVAYLELNDRADVEVENVEVRVEQFPGIRTVGIEEVFADRRQARAGDTIELALRVRDYRGAERIERFDHTLDADLDPGSHYLFVGDGPSVDAARLRIAPRENRTFEDALDQLGSFHSSKDLVVLGVDAEPGVMSAGGALAALPGSLREIWKSSSAGQVKGVSLAIVSEHASRRSEPLDGLGRVDLEILPPLP